MCIKLNRVRPLFKGNKECSPYPRLVLEFGRVPKLMLLGQYMTPKNQVAECSLCEPAII